MKCDEIKTLLNPYLDNEVAQADAELVKQHLRECSACAKEVSELRKVKEMLCELPVLTAPSELLEGIRYNLAHSNPEILQRSNAFVRYRWLTLSLASAAAVILVVFTVMIQSRKSEMPAPVLVSEKTKANFTASVMPKAETLDAIQAQPRLFTQQINISAKNVDNTVAKVYALASTQTPDLKLRAEYQKKQAAQEELLTKAPDEQPIQDENPTMTNSVAPLRENKIKQQRQLGQVVKISIPLSQKDAFIKQLKGDINITDKLVLSEMQAISRDKLTAGYLADAGKPVTKYEEQAKGDEPADQGARSYDAFGKGGGKAADSKPTEANKVEGGKLSKGKNEESKDTGVVITDSDKKPRESQKDNPAEQPKPSPKGTSPAPPAPASPPPPPPAAPAPSAPARGITPSPPSPPSTGFVKSPAKEKKEASQNKDMAKKIGAEDVKNDMGQTSQVQPEPMIEFTIVIEPTDK
jgi:hypothetical protein